MDQTLFHLINQQWTNPFLDLLLAALSNSEIWKPVFIIVALVALGFGGFKGRACVLSLLIVFLVTEQMTSVLKSTFDRRRPKQVQTVRMVQMERTRPAFIALFKKPTIRYSDRTDRDRSGPSFPSGHMTNNSVIATCLTIFYRRRGALYWIVAFAVGYSRIYLGAHWPSDIFATFFLATGETLLILAALELLWRFAIRKWKPEFFQRHPSLILAPPR
jgi:membrane-associated phospholipid phosphatase